MKEPSKLIMGATVVLVVILATILGLVLFLLAELYCSLLFSHHQNRKRDVTAAASALNDFSEQAQEQKAHSLRHFYSQGVLHAPRSFLFPVVSDTDTVADLENQQQESTISESQNCSSYTWPVEKNSLHSGSTSTRSNGEQLIYICNPIYDNEAIGLAGKVDNSNVNTPFETPDTSPSRLETGDSSPGSSNNSTMSSPILTPPLTPMKMLPDASAETSSSICLRDVRSICTTGSDSNSHKDGISSSSSSGSPRTSPSW